MTDDHIHRTLGNLEAKVDILLERTQEYDKRLATVEAHAGSTRTLAGMFGAGAAILASLFSGYFNK